MVSALRTSSLLQVAKQELRQTKGGGRDVYAGIRDSRSRYPRGWEGEWSGRLCPTLRGPHGGTRHTPPAAALTTLRLASPCSTFPAAPQTSHSSSPFSRCSFSKFSHPETHVPSWLLIPTLTPAPPTLGTESPLFLRSRRFV